MRRNRSKTINQTFSIPIEISQELHAYVKRQEMSRFVSNAIRRELEIKKEELRRCYLEANKDKGQIQAKKEWDVTVTDGSDEW